MTEINKIGHKADKAVITNLKFLRRVRSTQYKCLPKIRKISYNPETSLVLNYDK